MDAFYNRADFGYDVRHWQPEDVNQTIIDIVNQMGNDIVTNTRVTSISELLSAIGGSLSRYPNFIAATLFAIKKANDAIDIVSITTQKLVEERDKLKRNRLAWSVVTQVMAREKQNIEIAFGDYF